MVWKAVTEYPIRDRMLDPRESGIWSFTGNEEIRIPDDDPLLKRLRKHHGCRDLKADIVQVGCGPLTRRAKQGVT